MAKNYSTRFKVQRWPVVHFQNLLDITAINVITIFNFTHPEWSSKEIKYRRREGLIILAKQMAKPYMLQRLNNPGIHIDLVKELRHYTGQQAPVPPLQQNNNAATRHLRCRLCQQDGKAMRDANRASNQCTRCHFPCCKKHSSGVICDTCAL